MKNKNKILFLTGLTLFFLVISDYIGGRQYLSHPNSVQTWIILNPYNQHILVDFRKI
jgi:hypothetical protein